MAAGAAAVKAGYDRAVPLWAALLAIPEPAPEEPRPLAPAEHEWADRSGALVSGGVAGLWFIPGIAATLAVLRAGMHDYGFEWAVEGGAGGTIGEAGNAIQGDLVVGGRIPRESYSIPVHGWCGGLWIDGARSIAFGLDAGVEIPLGRMLRIEARASTGFAPGLDVPNFAGASVGVVAIP
jgi:hypothetical protein